MSSSAGNGLFYLIFGILLLWAESSVLDKNIKEPYIGWHLAQWAWFIFGAVLVLLGIYILANN